MKFNILIRNEDDFLFMRYQEYKRGELKVYPKVSSIPKGKDTKIAPDIDLLSISKKMNLIEGFELKYVWEKSPRLSFYSGLGQVLSYFRYGVDRAYLVLGLFNMDSNKMNKIENKFREYCLFLGPGILEKMPYLEINLFKEDRRGDINLLSRRTENQTKRFSVDDEISDKRFKNVKEEIIQRRNFLLHINFGWAERWLRKREKEFEASVREK